MFSMPMSSSSNATSSPCKNKLESVVVGSEPNGCVCNLPETKRLNKLMFLNFIFKDQADAGT